MCLVDLEGPCILQQVQQGLKPNVEVESEMQGSLLTMNSYKIKTSYILPVGNGTE